MWSRDGDGVPLRDLRLAYAKMSANSRSDGLGGKMYVPRAMYSLSTSFWTVRSASTPGRPAPRRPIGYIRSSSAAGALMVIEVETLSIGMPPSSTRMSSPSRSTPRPCRPRRARAGVGVVATGWAGRRRPTGPSLAVGDQLLVARVGLGRGADPRTAASSTGASYTSSVDPRVNGYPPGSPQPLAGVPAFECGPGRTPARSADRTRLTRHAPASRWAGDSCPSRGAMQRWGAIAV